MSKEHSPNSSDYQLFKYPMGSSPNDSTSIALQLLTKKCTQNHLNNSEISTTHTQSNREIIMQAASKQSGIALILGLGNGFSIPKKWHIDTLLADIK